MISSTKIFNNRTVDIEIETDLFGRVANCRSCISIRKHIYSGYIPKTKEMEDKYSFRQLDRQFLFRIGFMVQHWLMELELYNKKF